MVNTVTTQATHRVNMPPRREVVTQIQAYPWGHPKETDYYTAVYFSVTSPARPQAAPCGDFWALVEILPHPGRGRNTGARAAIESHVNMAGKTHFDGPGENRENPGKQGETGSRQDHNVRALPYWQSSRKLSRKVNIRIGASCRSGSRWPGNALRCDREFVGSVTIFGTQVLCVRGATASTQLRNLGRGSMLQALAPPK